MARIKYDLPVAPAVPAPRAVLVKPAGPDCNLECPYCFYLEKKHL